jgi:1-acyl-sn-glycerol-3-phosphate acyltransferase
MGMPVADRWHWWAATPLFRDCHTRAMPTRRIRPGADLATSSARTVTGTGRADRLAVQAPERPLWRYRLIRLVIGAVSHAYTGFYCEGAEMLPAGPAILCFSHQNWIDPFYLISILPLSPRPYYFGPQEEDMTRGARNRLMRWVGLAVPYQPGRRGLVAATRRVEELVASGNRVVIAGEGRIHSGEAVILPLLDGPAYMAIRSGVPLVPIAVNGTSWLAFRRRVRVRVGEPLRPAGTIGARPEPEAVADLTARMMKALLAMTCDFPDPPRSRWLGGRLTELFNDWPEGSRPAVPSRPDL